MCTEALVRLYDTVHSNADWLPRGLGVQPSIIKPKGIDDVPIFAISLYGKTRDMSAFELEKVAQRIEVDLKRVAGTREVSRTGGPTHALQVDIDPARLSAVGVSVADIRQALQSAHLGAPVGDLLVGSQAIAIEPLWWRWYSSRWGGARRPSSAQRW